MKNPLFDPVLLTAMPQPSALPAHPNRMSLHKAPHPLPPSLAALKATLRPLTTAGVMPFGDDRIDRCLPGGGLPLGQLHEVAATGLDGEAGALSAAFLIGLLARMPPPNPIFWIATTRDLHAPGLLAYGLDPGRLIIVHTEADNTVLTAMEIALRTRNTAAVVGEAGRLDRIGSHRLQLACLRHGVTGFMLRRWPYGRKAYATETGSVAVTRWHLTSALSVPEGPQELGHPRWQLALTHARGGQPGHWIVQAATEANDAAHPFRVVATLAASSATPASRHSRRTATGHS